VRVPTREKRAEAEAILLNAGGMTATSR